MIVMWQGSLSSVSSLTSMSISEREVQLSDMPWPSPVSASASSVAVV